MTPESEEILRRLRELKDTLQKDMGIKRLRVFGSVARGEATAESDVDLIADFETMPDWSYFSMDQDISKLLNNVSVDLAMENELHKALKDRILSEAKDVW